MHQDLPALLKEADLLFDTMQLKDARKRFEEITQLYPDHPDAWDKLCRLHAIQGEHQESLACCRKYVSLQRDSDYAQSTLAAALTRTNNHREAADIYTRLAEHNPDSAELSYSLAVALLSSNQLDKADDALQMTLEINPGHLDSRINLGILALYRGDYTDAEQRFRDVIAVKPDNAVAHCKLGCALQALGSYPEAVNHFDNAIRLTPNMVEAHFNRATVRILTDQSGEAISGLKEVIRLDPNHSGAYVNLATALLASGEAEEAMQHCNKALSIAPDNATAISLAATIEHRAGKTDKAVERLRKWVDTDNPNPSVVTSYAEICRSTDNREHAISLVNRLLDRRPDMHASVRCQLHFQLAQLYDRSGGYDSAFDHFKKANNLKGIRYNPESDKQLFSATISTNTRSALALTEHSDSESNRPVFVVGMPRSGTSLIEQILASHPKVHGAGELDEIPKILQSISALPDRRNLYPYCVPHLDRSTLSGFSKQYLNRLDQASRDAIRVIDKAPGNFRFLGLISLMFPNARVIHCIRNPLDTILSCYFQNFVGHHQPFCYDLDHLADYYQSYRNLMTHWKQSIDIPVLDVMYEDVVNDQEGKTRQLLEFCELDWHDDCLTFHKSSRFVATSSYDQVRRPLYRSSISRWKNYERHLGGLVERFSKDIRTD